MDKRSDGRSRMRDRRRRGFTLIELLVVMGIIAVLGVLTTIGYRGIAKDAKLSSAKNTVAAVLDNARGLAMKNNRLVVVTFRPRLENGKQRIEVVAAQFTGESIRVNVGGGGSWQVVDRFAPVPGVANRVLPEGITLASPGYGSGGDTSWIALSHLPNILQGTGPGAGLGEAPGEIIGVMFAPDGTTQSRNTATDSARMFVDYNNDGEQDWGNITDVMALPVSAAQFNGAFFEMRLENDEPFVDIAPFVSVISDDEVRELYDVTQWDINVSAAAFANRLNDYSQYITNNLDPIYFNRYTGVAMR